MMVSIYSPSINFCFSTSLPILMLMLSFVTDKSQSEFEAFLRINRKKHLVPITMGKSLSKYIWGKVLLFLLSKPLYLSQGWNRKYLSVASPQCDFFGHHLFCCNRTKSSINVPSPSPLYIFCKWIYSGHYFQITCVTLMSLCFSVLFQDLYGIA